MNKDTNKTDKIQPELCDIITSLHRYLAVHKNNAAFVLSFIAFREGKCDDCGDETDNIVDDEGSRVMAYGNKTDLRILLEELRNVIEDESDKDGFISV